MIRVARVAVTAVLVAVSLMAGARPGAAATAPRFEIALLPTGVVEDDGSATLSVVYTCDGVPEGADAIGGEVFGGVVQPKYRDGASPRVSAVIEYYFEFMCDGAQHRLALPVRLFFTQARFHPGTATVDVYGEFCWLDWDTSEGECTGYSIPRTRVRLQPSTT